MSVSLLAGCNAGTGGGTSRNAGEGKVYYLNFKPEVDRAWQEIAAAYTAETGIEVKVVTAASGQYEATLKAEMAKSDAPTLFQVNGPIGYAAWQDYCKDLADTEVYGALIDKEMAISVGDAVYAIPYAIETYGIIYNDAIMRRYFATSNPAAKSMKEINNFVSLKAVVEDMSAKKDELEIEGVFASTSLQKGEDWRWHTHLANMPIYYEYKDAGVADMEVIEFSYADNYRAIFDLYTENSITPKTLLGSKDVSDSMAEFALGEVAMVQNGTWGWGQIAEETGNVVQEEDVKFLPIYIGVDGEEDQGLCTGTENFWCVNSKASVADQKATQDFMYWLISSETGKEAMLGDLELVTPFSTFTQEERPNNPLIKESFRYMEEGKHSVSWVFPTFPSENFKQEFGGALLGYSAGNLTWDEVVELVVEKWTFEKMQK